MRRALSTCLVLPLVLATSAAAAGLHDEIDVMSQNQYLGADLDPVIAAGDLLAFNAALVAALQQIAANDLPARAQRLAQLIALRGADLVGQQEVFRFECFNLPGPGPDCDEPSIAGAFNDHLAEVLAELDALGRPYEVAGVVRNLDLTTPLAPGLPPGVPVDVNFDLIADITVTVLDRDVVLARAGVATSPVAFPCSRPSADGCHYDTVGEVMSPLGPIRVERGFVGVDAVVDGRDYRFVNTHLEVQSPLPTPPGTPEGVEPGASIQAAQASELAALIAAAQLTDPPPPGARTILVGDINSSPEDGIFTDPFFPDPDQPLVPPYTQLAMGVDLFGQPAPAGAWTDAWTELPVPRDGFTCCQAADLSNPRSELDERIDVIFSLEPPRKVRLGFVLGSTFFSKIFPQGLWPSDHGQPSVRLEY